MRARDLRGMTEDRWLGLAPKPATDQGPVCSTFGAGSQLISSAESAREAGRKPAVVRAKTDNKESDLQDVFYGSDGTRTRDLRRDRPVLVVPG